MSDVTKAAETTVIQTSTSAAGTSVLDPVATQLDPIATQLATVRGDVNALVRDGSTLTEEIVAYELHRLNTITAGVVQGLIDHLHAFHTGSPVLDRLLTLQADTKPAPAV